MNYRQTTPLEQHAFRYLDRKDEPMLKDLISEYRVTPSQALTLMGLWQNNKANYETIKL